MKFPRQPKSQLPFQNFLTARQVLALLENDMQQGVYSQFSCFYRKTFLQGASIVQTKMFDYPDTISGVHYCQKQAKYDLWSFGLIIGAKGSDTDLVMVTCSGGKRSEYLINIMRPFEVVDRRVRYKGSPTFDRVTMSLEASPPSADEAETWAISFSA